MCPGGVLFLGVRRRLCPVPLQIFSLHVLRGQLPVQSRQPWCMFQPLCPPPLGGFMGLAFPFGVNLVGVVCRLCPWGESELLGVLRWPFSLTLLPLELFLVL
jgi:hypothetical protein